jgi:ribosomal protein S18 acetylase RimI-like enzyme
LKYHGESKDKVIAAIEKTIPLYRFDQYVLYPSECKTFWQKYLLQRISSFILSEESSIFYETDEDYAYLLGCRISKWDEAHFGFKMAMLNWIIYPDIKISSAKICKLLEECISFLSNIGVKYVSAHVSGEDILALHLLEDKGFRYYETTVFPIAQSDNLPYKKDTRVRLCKEGDLPAVIQIAKDNQFEQGHFYCDAKFDRKNVDRMYEKWIRTSWNNKELIAVIENEGNIAGYFIFIMDEDLSRATKYSYGRMISLAMDASNRGKGLGSSLFRSVICLIAESGGQYVASDYSLKNYSSGFLHTRNQFYSAHEKILLHLWL